MKASATHLTQRTIDAALRGVGSERQRLRCHDVPGLSVVVHKRHGTFNYEYKPQGLDPDTGRRFSTRHIRIGDTSSHSLAEARIIAADLRRRVREGGDPKSEAAAAAAAAWAAKKAAAAEAAAKLTCQDKLEMYGTVLATRGLSPRRQREQLGQIRLGLTSVAALTLAPREITAPIIEKLLAACPAASRDTRFGALDRFLRWACKGGEHVAATLLFERYERPKPPPSRRRVLSGAEIAAIWRAAEKLPNAVTADLVQFVITVPCRRGEAAEARWRDIDLAAKVWRQPTSKNDDPHAFPLNERALAILTRRRKATGGHPDDFVFPGPRAAKPFMGWSNLIEAIAARIDQATPIVGDWRLHDIRRSFVTHLAEAGHDETVLDLILNHRAARSRSGVRGIYQRAVRWPERVAALAAWADLLRHYLGENVEHMRRAGTGVARYHSEGRIADKYLSARPASRRRI
jgi:integrase